MPATTQQRAFTVPAALEADTPPERRGVARDAVRLLVASPAGISHAGFRDLPGLLRAGDLIVVNTSATVPAALDGRRSDGSRATVHVGTELDSGEWVVELRRPDGRGPVLDASPGTRVDLPGATSLTLVAPYPDAAVAAARLWRATITPAVSRVAHLAAHGRPIRYGHSGGGFPLSDYQNVYAAEPGSAEMASAGRPFTSEVIVRLLAAGVIVAPVVLHAGVSSPEAHEPPIPERLVVPVTTARLVEAARAAGNRVVAVGTTVVRALESAALAGGRVVARDGWTDLVLGRDRPARVVTGLITGLHLPGSSHLHLLEAVAGEALVAAAYAAAVEQGYLWHEFGDSMLLLP